MKKNLIYLLSSGIMILVISFLFCTSYGSKPEIGEFISEERTPNIDPDYVNVVLPPNIAPMNFMIKEKGQNYYVKIDAENGQPIEINAKNGKIQIPMSRWKKLLSENVGKKLNIEIYAQNAVDTWIKYKTIENQIAVEPIDSYLAYRLLHPAFNLWTEMGIYQRNLETFDEQPILINRVTEGNCMNCHNFCKNDPNKMIFHMRAGKGSGMFLNNKGKLNKVNTSTAFNKAGAYPSWHPSGKAIAMSVNKLSMFFHATGEARDVLDHNSNLFLYMIETNTVTTGPAISRPDRMETFPCWSADGKYLYFCSAPLLATYIEEESGDTDLKYDEISYDLMRVSYDLETDTWGELETVLTSDEVGGSITIPRTSPDGRYILFTKAAYGNFPIYLKSADLGILDLETGEHSILDINSERQETFHSWSGNSRWFVFSSKRRDGFTSRPYFSYMDSDGKAHKPFVMPQEDPEFYGSFYQTYNVPEMIAGPVTIRPQEIAEAALGDAAFLQAKLDPRIQPEQEDTGEETLYKQASQ